MRRITILFVLLFKLTLLNGQVSDLKKIESFTSLNVWEAGSFNSLLSQLNFGNNYTSIDGLSSFSIDSALIYITDSFKIFGSAGQGKDVQSICSFSADTNYFSFIKSQFTRDSILQINFTLITKDGVELLEYSGGEILISNSNGELYTIDPLDIRGLIPEKVLSSFEVVIDTNYWGDDFLSITNKYLNDVLLSLDLNITHKTLWLTSFQPNNCQNEMGMAFLMKFVYGRISLTSNYLYISYDQTSNENFTKWVEKEFSNLLSPKGNVSIGIVNDKLLMPYGATIILPFLEPVDIIKIPYNLYNPLEIPIYSD